MAYSEDHIALAAEYALGTLDADERAQVESLMSVDADFAAMVQAWEYRLGVLNQMVGSVDPSPEVWDRIRTAIGLSEPQAPLLLPEVRRRRSGTKSQHLPPTRTGRPSSASPDGPGAGAPSPASPRRSRPPWSR